MASFVAVGDVMVDVVTGERPASPPVHADVRLRVGGGAANAAVAAAAAGAEATVVGRVGDDTVATLVEEELRSHAVRPLLARDPTVSTGVLVVTPTGIVANRGANAMFGPDDVPDRLEADAVLLSGWVLLQGDTTRAGEAALERARAEWIAVDPSSARLLARFGRDRFLAVTTRATAVIANQDEAEVLSGTHDPNAAADALARRYRLACVTLGASGAVAVLDGRRERAAPRDPVEGDLFGAGDASAGTLLAELARGADLNDALAAACEAGAAVTGRRT